MIDIKSKYEGTAIVVADAGNAVTIAQGTPLTLHAAHTHPAAVHEWDLGDGTTATGVSVTHVYPKPGLYVVKLATVVNQDGGARTRHFVGVTVSNAAPKVDAGPDLTVNEGDVVPLSGTFSDKGWLDQHTAVWLGGDDQPPEVGKVAEQHDPPTGLGTASATHAWGDAGTYVATLAVRDDHGATGRDDAMVTVLNVPPTVELSGPRYSYPNAVVTFAAHFTDPGWLNTHTAQWDFGDGTSPTTATIDEVHAPPRGTGTAWGSHSYPRRGNYCCTCTVIDDHGGIGVATQCVEVVDVVNAGFEEGFRGLTAGSVGNEWDPYAASIAEFQVSSLPIAMTAGMFSAETKLVRDGQRSQRIQVDGASRAGVYQRIGANPDWAYQVTVWYCALENSGGMVRLGVDPSGGVNATASSVAWTIGRALGRWEQLAVRAVARGDAITIFIEAVGRYRSTRVEEKAMDFAASDRGARDRGQGIAACFDGVGLLAVQPFCRPPELRPEPPSDPAAQNQRDPNHPQGRDPALPFDRDSHRPAGRG